MSQKYVVLDANSKKSIFFAEFKCQGCYKYFKNSKNIFPRISRISQLRVSTVAQHTTTFACDADENINCMSQNHH